MTSSMGQYFLSFLNLKPDSPVYAFFHACHTIWGSIVTPLEPGFSIGLFLASTCLMIWRLEALQQNGLEGTVLGTLIMPYCSGFSNLMFALVMGRSGGNGSYVLENCLVNNVTNLTLLLGLPAIFWHLTLYLDPASKGRSKLRSKAKSRRPSKDQRLNRLSILLTLIAAMFFAGVTWALGKDGILDFGDGLVLVGLFLFWQVFHVFDVLKQNVRTKRRFSYKTGLDILLIIASGWGTYQSIENLVAWIPQSGSSFLITKALGWLSGILMVIPNAFLAFYYARIGRSDIVYSSQSGDGHICIPMCIGLFALAAPIQIPAFFQMGIGIIVVSALIHFLFIATIGRLPRVLGVALSVVYFVFLYQGLFNPFS